MHIQWILIANAAHARLLQREEGRRMVLLQSFEHPRSRLRSSALANDKAAREPGSRGFSGPAFVPRLDAQHKQRLQFARELAHVLDEGGRSGRYQSLCVFASSPFLGELKHELADGTRRLLVEKRDVDLTSVGLAELEQRLEYERTRGA